jgi:hypothetical protein
MVLPPDLQHSLPHAHLPYIVFLPLHPIRNLSFDSSLLVVPFSDMPRKRFDQTFPQIIFRDKSQSLARPRNIRPRLPYIANSEFSVDRH